MEHMQFDETSLTPIFIQVAQWLEDEILKGHILEEEQVPSTNQFAVVYRMNPATARKGFALLVEEGILYKKRGIGMFVSTGAKEKIRKRKREQFIRESVAMLMSEADKLGITGGEVIEIIQSYIEKAADT